MRTLMAFLFMSLDGVVEEPSDFARSELYPEFTALIGETIADQDCVLLGRKTYDEWSGFWPGSDIEPFAGFINNVPKLVAASGAAPLEWIGSRRLGGDLVAAVAALKAQPGKVIGVHGSIRLVQSLLIAGLVDELRVILCPIIAGRGRRLLNHDGDPLQLYLQASRATGGGLHYLVYRTRPG
jgi:dihydrofolate reductase